MCTIADICYYLKQPDFLVTWCTLVAGFSKHTSISVSYSANWDRENSK